MEALENLDRLVLTLALKVWLVLVHEVDGAEVESTRTLKVDYHALGQFTEAS